MFTIAQKLPEDRCNNTNAAYIAAQTTDPRGIQDLIFYQINQCIHIRKCMDKQRFRGKYVYTNTEQSTFSL